jgi:hypothetical protein
MDLSGHHHVYGDDLSRCFMGSARPLSSQNIIEPLAVDGCPEIFHEEHEGLQGLRSR